MRRMTKRELDQSEEKPRWQIVEVAPRGRGEANRVIPTIGGYLVLIPEGGERRWR
jgi:hypothetical protein